MPSADKVVRPAIAGTRWDDRRIVLYAWSFDSTGTAEHVAANQVFGSGETVPSR